MPADTTPIVAPAYGPGPARPREVAGRRRGALARCHCKIHFVWEYFTRCRFDEYGSPPKYSVSNLKTDLNYLFWTIKICMIYVLTARRQIVFTVVHDLVELQHSLSTVTTMCSAATVLLTRLDGSN